MIRTFSFYTVKNIDSIFVPFWVPTGTPRIWFQMELMKVPKIKFQKGTGAKVTIFVIYQPIFFMKLVALNRYYQAK
jgi:hypothetical protein